MTSLKTRQADKIFEKLGVERVNCTHHEKGYLVYNGKRRFPPVYFSRGRKDIPAPVVEKFRKSLLLNKAEFGELSRCHMTATEYFSIRSERE